MLVGGGDAALPLERHLLVAAVKGPVSRLRREGLCATDLALVSLAELNRHVVASQGPCYLLNGHRLVVALQAAVSRLGDHDLRAARGATVPLAHLIRHISFIPPKTSAQIGGRRFPIIGMPLRSVNRKASFPREGERRGCAILGRNAVHANW